MRPLRLSLLLVPLSLGACQKGSGPARLPDAAAPTARFEDVAEASGLRFRHSWGDPPGPVDTLQTTGAGGAFLDFDDDGDLDVYLVNSGKTNGRRPLNAGRSPNRLFRNNGDGTFAALPASAAPGRDFGMGCSAADYDGDGRVDLFVTNYGVNQLYRNEGNGRFSERTAAAGVGGRSDEFSTASAWADVTGDGRPDLYVTNYCVWDPALRWCRANGVDTACSPMVYKPQPNHLWQNLGNGRFRDITRPSGTANPEGKGLACLFSDLDADGRQDLFVSNDGTGNKLYRQTGPGRFEDLTLQAGVGFDENGKPQAGMGCDLADLNGTGRFSLIVATFQNEVKSLYRQSDGFTFTNETQPSGLSATTRGSLAFGAAWLDYDLDGDSDLLLTNGHVQDNIDRVSRGIAYGQRPQLFRNDGGRFVDVSATAGPAFETPLVARGLVVGDYDNDGDPDALINNSGGAASLFKNGNSNGNHWIGFRLIGKSPNTGALSARVTLQSGERRTLSEVRSSGGYLGSPDPRQLFGLGSAGKVERVTVRWPGGRTSVIENPGIDRYHDLRE